MLILLLLLLLKYYPEEKIFECLLLKQQWKNVPNRSEQWFKRRTWLEELVLLYIIWTGNTRILDVSESHCGQICPDTWNAVSMPEYAWNIMCQSSKYVHSHKKWKDGLETRTGCVFFVTWVTKILRTQSTLAYIKYK